MKYSISGTVLALLLLPTALLWFQVAALRDDVQQLKETAALAQDYRAAYVRLNRLATLTERRVTTTQKIDKAQTAQLGTVFAELYQHNQRLIALEGYPPMLRWTTQHDN